MSTDERPERQSEPQAKRAQQHRQRQAVIPGGWWKHAPLAIVLVAVVASVAGLIPSARSAKDGTSKLTHTIQRDDLIVTVTAQGLLESAENTEIKCQVRGLSTVIWVIDGGTVVQPGDELVRLDTLAIEDTVNERSKYAHWSRSSAERSKADVARAELAISEYLEGRYLAEVKTREKELAVAQSDLRTAQNLLDHAEMMAKRGYVSDLDVEDSKFALTQAELNVDLVETQIDVLKRFTKSLQLETLKGNLNASKARHDANVERAVMDATRRDLAVEELEHCVIKSERSGMVIHPSAAKWEVGPEIEPGATVYYGQVLLLMPDLSDMQVKVGIHESDVDRVQPELAAEVTLPGKTLHGEVFSVASVTRPVGWWSGNVVTYDTIIKLPSVPGLKPGMSAEVEVLVARHEDVLTIPVAAVVETEQGDFCWVEAAAGARRRSLRLGDTNDVFTVVKAGLKEGDEVLLNPFAFEEAPTEAESKTQESTLPADS